MAAGQRRHGSGPTPGASYVDRLVEADRAALLRLGTLRRFPRNARLFHEGERSTFVVVVRSGRLKMVTLGEGGGETVLGVRGPGTLVGELAAVDMGPRTASAIALDAVTVRIIAADAFRRFVTAHPDAAVGLIRMLMGRLSEGDRRRSEFGALDATVRVARLIVDLAHDVGGATGGDRRISLAQHELAGMAGTSRESVVRALATLRAEGLVSTARGAITVHDVDRLRRFVG